MYSDHLEILKFRIIEYFCSHHNHTASGLSVIFHGKIQTLLLPCSLRTIRHNFRHKFKHFLPYLSLEIKLQLPDSTGVLPHGVRNPTVMTKLRTARSEIPQTASSPTARKNPVKVKMEEISVDPNPTWPKVRHSATQCHHAACSHVSQPPTHTEPALSTSNIPQGSASRDDYWSGKDAKAEDKCKRIIKDLLQTLWKDIQTTTHLNGHQRKAGLRAYEDARLKREYGWHWVEIGQLPPGTLAHVQARQPRLGYRRALYTTQHLEAVYDTVWPFMACRLKNKDTMLGDYSLPGVKRHKGQDPGNWVASDQPDPENQGPQVVLTAPDGEKHYLVAHDSRRQALEEVPPSMLQPKVDAGYKPESLLIEPNTPVCNEKPLPWPGIGKRQPRDSSNHAVLSGEAPWRLDRWTY